MKIIISSTGKTLKDDVDARFGRCNYFLIIEIDEKTKKIKEIRAIKNTAQAQMGGAGITSAQIVANEEPDAVITVNTGPRAFQVLNQLKIRIYQGNGKIEQVIEDYLKGNLKEIKNFTGPMHMGA